MALPSVMRFLEGAFLDEGKATTRSTNEIWETSDRILSVCSTAWSIFPSSQHAFSTCLLTFLFLTFFLSGFVLDEHVRVCW
jgi:hypothetical protein